MKCPESPTPKSVKAVFFDADGTLFSIHPNVGSVYRRVCRRHDFEVSEQSINQRIRSLWGPFQGVYLNAENDYATSEEREYMVWKQLCRELLDGLVTSEAFDRVFADIFNEFTQPETRNVHPGLRTCLTELREKGYALGVLSNNDKRLLKLLSNLELTDHFDSILPTSEVGYKKPSPHAFGAAADSVGVFIEDLLFVGDDLTLDIHGALAAGCQAVWYNPKGEGNSTNPPVSIQSFEELQVLLRVSE